MNIITELARFLNPKKTNLRGVVSRVDGSVVWVATPEGLKSFTTQGFKVDDQVVIVDGQLTLTPETTQVFWV
jgi:hypothetical protein